MPAKKRKSDKWIAENVAWHKAIREQAEEWIAKDFGEKEASHPSVRSVVMRRVNRLQDFLNWFFPDAPPDPFHYEDGAALVLLPRWEALKVARKLFRGGPGIAGDLRPEDIERFNLDWFHPKGERF